MIKGEWRKFISCKIVSKRNNLCTICNEPAKSAYEHACGYMQQGCENVILSPVDNFRSRIKKHSFSLLTGIFIACASTAQMAHIQLKTPSSIQTEADLEQFLSKSFDLNINLEERHHIKYRLGVHISYAIYLEDYPLYPAEVKWNKFEDHTTLSIPDFSFIGKINPNDPPSNSALLFAKKYGQSYSNIKAEIKWVLDENELSKRWIITSESASELQEMVLDDDGEIIWSIDRTLHDRPDTLVYINVFNPDPLTTAEKPYGTPLADNDDAANPALDAQMFKDTIRMRWNEHDSTWQLRSDVAIAVDVQAPFDPVPVFKNNQGIDALTNRSHPWFEYFNAFYHIQKTHDLLVGLEMGHLADYPLRFDARGSTADQSSFVPSDENPLLIFGTGGVDDAEDADVIVHEYAHAISFSATPNTNYGAQRSALDEGFCDYMALSYSRRLSTFNRNEIFNWDGHNEFWDGRSLTNTRTYPTDLNRDIYSDGILWTSALAEISDYIGLDATDKIMLHSLHSWYSNMKMSDASRLFLQSDSILNQGKNTEISEIILCNRGLLNGCEDTLSSSLPFTNPYLGNTFDFAYNNEPLFIFPNRRIITGVEIFDLQGKRIHSETWSESNQLIYPFDGSMLRQGVYVMVIHTTDGKFPFKITRLWL